MNLVTQDKQDCLFFIVICFAGETSAKFEPPLNKNFSSATIYTQTRYRDYNTSTRLFMSNQKVRII